MKITWDKSWNIGHKGIDKQHQRWAELFNTLDAAFHSDSSTDEVLRATVTQMVEYTIYHFAFEEKLMADKKYPGTADQRRLHKDFDNIVYENFRKMKDGDLVLNSEILSIIKDWLLGHIQVEDQKFGAYLKTLEEVSFTKEGDRGFRPKRR